MRLSCQPVVAAVVKEAMRSEHFPFEHLNLEGILTRLPPFPSRLLLQSTTVAETVGCGGLGTTIDNSTWASQY
jgi:hypothetical protein